MLRSFQGSLLYASCHWFRSANIVSSRFVSQRQQSAFNRPIPVKAISWSCRQISLRASATDVQIKLQESNEITGDTPSNKPQVIILTGPTAVGKTNAALALAERIGGEIISADSVQVYSGLDVGSDKVHRATFVVWQSDHEICNCLPTAQMSTAVAQILLAERRGIPHHLLDILSPKEEFSAGDFYTLARTATADILQVRSPCLIALLYASFCLLFTSSNTTPHIFHPPQSNHDNYIIIGDFSFVLV